MSVDRAPCNPPKLTLGSEMLSGPSGFPTAPGARKHCLCPWSLSSWHQGQLAVFQSQARGWLQGTGGTAPKLSRHSSVGGVRRQLGAELCPRPVLHTDVTTRRPYSGQFLCGFC